MPIELGEDDLSSLAALLMSCGIESEDVILDPWELRNYQRDMGRPPELFNRMLSATEPAMVVRPQTPEQLSSAIKTLYSQKVPFTPRGIGSTGLGGAVPIPGGVVVDLSRMSGIQSLDAKSGVVQVLAGTSFYRIESALEAQGLELKSRPSNAFGTIGGWAAGGGLGLGSLAAGPLVQQVESIHVINPDGSQDHLDHSSRRFEDFFQTEGQLGLFSSFTLRTAKRRFNPLILALSAANMSSALDCVQTMLEQEPLPAEVTLLGKAKDHPGLSVNPEHEIMLAVWKTPSPSLDLPPSAVVLPQQAADTLWSKRFFPMDNRLGPIFLASEALVPLEKVESLSVAARKRAKRFHTSLMMHGHLVRVEDRVLVLMLFMFPCDPQRGWNHLMLTPLAAILTAVARRKGARPYGVGIWNAPFAKKAMGPERMAKLLDRKKRQDPDNLCNPGKFFKVGTKAKTLPLLMAKGVYSTMLSLASGAGPLLMGSTSQKEDQKPAFERCVWCGACISTCPAVAVTGQESVSARAKLSLMKKLHEGSAVSKNDLADALQCLACGQCQQVCARGLDLLDEWQKLQAMLRAELDDQVFTQTLNNFTDMVDRRRDKAMDAALP